jgi:Protein of unknown function (DUF1153)
MLPAAKEEDPDTASDVWASLPIEANVRWTPWRKRDVVLALRDGAITVPEAIERYRLSREELADWIECFERHGVSGLQVKRKRWAPAIAARANRIRAI